MALGPRYWMGWYGWVDHWVDCNFWRQNSLHVLGHEDKDRLGFAAFRSSLGQLPTSTVEESEIPF